jgi:hypothetical protein
VVRREVEDRVGVVGIADGHPQVSLARAVGSRHPQFHRGIVAVDHAREQQTPVHQPVERIEQVRRPGQPVPQRGAGEGDPTAGQLPGQSVQGRVVGKLGGDDVSQQAGAAQPLGDRTDLSRPGGLQPLLRRDARGVAVPAGVALLAGPQHEEAGRLQVELLGRLLADTHPRPSATGAEFFGLGQVVDDVPARQVLGQHSPAVLVPTFGRFVVGLGFTAFGPAFAAAAEAVLQGRVELGFQLGVLGTQPGHFGEQLPDHRLQRGDVVGQGDIGGSRRGVHAR